MAAPEGEMEVPGFEQFKRWENFMAPRVSLTGQRFAPDAVWNAMVQYKQGYSIFAAGDWKLLGPTTSTVPSNGGGAGRCNFVTVHPTTPSTIWVGSPGGGLWKTTDGGNTWNTNTDQLPQVIGCSDLVIDKNNTQIMYLATGDAYAGNTYSVGLLKTTDGGATWNTTGLFLKLPAYQRIGKVLIDPTNSNTLYVASTGGVYKSTDAGVTFTISLIGSFKDIEFQPGTPQTLYVCGNEFYRTINGGTAWTKITAVLPAAASCERMAIAVSDVSPTTVYLVAANIAPNYDLQGLYKSTNSGAAFTKLTVGSAIIGTQGFYALSIAASPIAANEIVVGGLDVWKCSNVPNSGTASFTQQSYWSGGSPYVHADIHELEYNGSTIYSACDGGLFVTSDGGSSWSDKSEGLQISQMYGFGQSTTNANLLITGWQDNGTNRLNGTSWSQVIGGDGMKAFISHGNDQNQWGSLYYGTFQRSTNGGIFFSQCTSGITEFDGPNKKGPWVAEYNEDPTTANTIYGGFANVWKSTNGGTAWTKLGTISSSTVYVQAIAAAPTTNGQVILAAKGSILYRTTNGGTAWTAVTGLPNGTFSDIAFHPTNPNKAWVTYSGFSNVNKVFQTTDQGVTWTNISASIPNIPVNCITVDKNGNDALYLGTDAGVFYKDASSIVWQPFFKGLPNVVINQLEIYYSGSKIRACTYGRGIWESSLYTPGAYAPDANFAGNNLIGCPGLGVQFTDYSAGAPTSWSWSFPGGKPSSSTAQNPFVSYNTTGTYSVSLTVNNTVGPQNTETFNGYITINSSQVAPTASSYTICGPQTLTLTATASAPGTIRWWNQPAGGNILGSVPSGTPYITTLSGTQTLYVDEAFPSGNIDFVGRDDNTVDAGGVFTANDVRGLYFDVFKPVMINSVNVYSTTAGVRTIEILDENGNLVTDTTLNIAASGTVTPTTVTINRTVYPGKNYFMKFRGNVDAFRNQAGTPFPLTDGGSGCVTITETNAGSPGYYYFFYKWTITPLVCNTGRTPVQITDPCTVGINDLFTSKQVEVYPNPNNGEFILSFNIDNIDNYKIKVTNSIGQVVYEEMLNDFNGAYSKKIDISAFQKGVYLLNISNTNNGTVKKVLVY
jgi:PKD repeat protein/photosystem II stability/assembly factor-like uncharacterized protein